MHKYIYLPLYKYNVPCCRWSNWCTYNFFLDFSFCGRSSHIKFDKLLGRDNFRVFFSGNFESPDVRPPLREESNVPSRAHCVLALFVNGCAFSWLLPIVMAAGDNGTVDTAAVVELVESGVNCKLLRLLYLRIVKWNHKCNKIDYDHIRFGRA